MYIVKRVLAAAAPVPGVCQTNLQVPNAVNLYLTLHHHACTDWASDTLARDGNYLPTLQ